MDVLVGQDRAVERLRRARRTARARLPARGSSWHRGRGPRFAAAILDPVDASAGEVSRRALRGLHPDVVEFEPDGNQILVAQADAIMREAYRSPIEGDRKIVIVLEADRLNEASSNKLLKTLEEPPTSTTMVLVTSSPDDLLDTVRSRCHASISSRCRRRRCVTRWWSRVSKLASRGRRGASRRWTPRPGRAPGRSDGSRARRVRRRCGRPRR